DLAASLREAVDPAGGQHGLRLRAEEPVDDVHLVAGQLRVEALRVLPEEAPVEQVVEVGIAPLRRVVVGRGRLPLAPPRAVAVPYDARVIDVAELAGPHDALVGGLVHRVVVPLVADLEHPPALALRLQHALAARLVPG